MSERKRNMTTVTGTNAISRAVAPLQGIAAPPLPSILFVEDEASDFIFARYQLEHLNVRNPIIHVLTATEMFAFLNGYDGYSDRRKYPLPGIIVLDIRLPDSNGIEAQAILRSSLKHRKIPIISISGDNRIALLQQSVKLGANAWMTKPFNATDFLTITARLNLEIQIAS